MNHLRKGRCPKMNRKQFVLTLLVAVISGFLGGALSVWFLMPSSVLAQDEPQKVIEAQGFRVVDEDGNTLAILDGLFGGSLRLTGGDGEVEINSSTSSFIPDESVLPRLVLQPNRIHLRNEEGTRDIQLDRDGVITAKGFVLKDSEGRRRAELGPSLSEHPVLWFYDEEGKQGTVVGSDSISFHEGQGRSRGFLNGSGASFSDTDGKMLRLGTSFLYISEDNGSFITIAGGDTPRIEIIDEEGFQAILGSTSTVETRTGRTNQTSAASLILFGKDGKAIWSAP